MTHLVLVILAVIWAAVLLPPFLQNRSESRPADSISTFRNQLHVLERRSLGTPAPSRPLSVRPVSASARFDRAPLGTVDRARLARMAAKKRRRDVLVTLLAAAGLTLGLSLLLPQVLLLHIAIDVLLGAFVALLVRQQRLAEERSMKVRYLAEARPARRQAPARSAPAQLGLRPAAAR